jgi:hypothetical protein
MEKGINLALTKSLFEFESLLVTVIEALSSEKRSVSHGNFYSMFHGFFEDVPTDYKIGKYVYIHYGDKINDGIRNAEGHIDANKILSFVSSSYKFWIVFGWEENDKRQSCLWLQFEAASCPKKIMAKINKLAGTSGKYYSKADFKSTHEHITKDVCFFMKDEYLKQFYNEDVALNAQKKILAGFINEVLEKTTGGKLYGKRRFI